VDQTQRLWGERLGTLRKASRLSQTEMAAQIGVSAVTLCRIERGHRPPRLAEALELSRILGVPVEVLFSTSPPNDGEIAA